jgi:putative component of membrane protein insertase Oxa1/YidC/SpoIIIJ protein YidD
MKKLFIILFTPLVLFGDPWGKDADLAFKHTTPSCNTECQTPFFGKFAETAIGFHQKIISPADGPRSHFIPSSSQYTLDAMRKYGFLKGFILGCDRLMRENDDPWLYPTIEDENGFTMKYNPVP